MLRSPSRTARFRTSNETRTSGMEEEGMDKDINVTIDHTNLRPEATEADIARLCDEAREHGFATVAINSCWTSFASDRLVGSGVGVTTCVGFPLGASSTASKAAETTAAVADGTSEVDMVISLGHLLSGDDVYVCDDIAAVVRAAAGRPVKVILECCLLDHDQIVRGCQDAVSAGASFVKTSTGFSKGGATVADVRLMRETVGNSCKVKAAGGIHTRDDALAMLAAGADRIGTSSGLAIVAG